MFFNNHKMFSKSHLLPDMSIHTVFNDFNRVLDFINGRYFISKYLSGKYNGLREIFVPEGERKNKTIHDGEFQMISRLLFRLLRTVSLSLLYKR